MKGSSSCHVGHLSRLQCNWWPNMRSLVRVGVQDRLLYRWSAGSMVDITMLRAASMVATVPPCKDSMVALWPSYRR